MFRSFRLLSTTALLNSSFVLTGISESWQTRLVFSRCLRLFAQFGLLYWKSMMWFVVETADAPLPPVSITAARSELSLQGPTYTTSPLHLYISSHINSQYLFYLFLSMRVAVLYVFSVFCLFFFRLALFSILSHNCPPPLPPSLPGGIY